MREKRPKKVWMGQNVCLFLRTSGSCDCGEPRVRRLFVIVRFGLPVQFEPTPHSGSLNFVSLSDGEHCGVESCFYGSKNEHFWRRLCAARLGQRLSCRRRGGERGDERICIRDEGEEGSKLKNLHRSFQSYVT